MVAEEAHIGRQEGGSGRSGGGKANAQRMHSLLNVVMQERDMIFFFFFLSHAKAKLTNDVTKNTH